MAVRGLGCPVRFHLTAGQRGDAPQGLPLIEGLPAQVVMGDTAYDGDDIRKAIAQKGALAVIPNNPSRSLKHPLDEHLYAQRHLVECCFSRLKQFRRVATRFEKTARNYLAIVTWPPSCSGYAKCPQLLAHHRKSITPAPDRHPTTGLPLSGATCDLTILGDNAAGQLPAQGAKMRPLQYLACLFLKDGHRWSQSRRVAGYETCRRCRIRRRVYEVRKSGNQDQDPPPGSSPGLRT